MRTTMRQLVIAKSSQAVINGCAAEWSQFIVIVHRSTFHQGKCNNRGLIIIKLVGYY